MKSILITGTKGKTTLIMWLDFILRIAGKKTLCICSEGVYKNSILLRDNDFYLEKYRTSANVAAIKELKRNDIENCDFLLLETSYAGNNAISKSILANKFDLGVLTNVYSDHINDKTIKNQNDLLVKKVECLKHVKRNGKYLIFTGNNKSNVSSDSISILKKDRPKSVIYSYAVKHKVRQTRQFFINRGKIVKDNDFLIDFFDVPMCFKDFHIPTRENILALVSIFDLLKLNLDIIKTSKSLDNIVPGRMNLFENKNKTVILDYAHELQSIKMAAKMLRKRFEGKRLIAVVRFSYYRNKKTIRSLTKQISPLFDDFIVYDKAISRPKMREIFSKKYGMYVGEVADIMEEVFKVKEISVKKIGDEFQAIKEGISMINASDVLYVIGDQMEQDIKLIKKLLKLK